jgi:hypothetical protein
MGWSSDGYDAPEDNKTSANDVPSTALPALAEARTNAQQPAMTLAMYAADE